MGIGYPPAPMDKLTRWLTAFVLAIVAGCGIAALFMRGQDRTGMLFVFAILAVFTLGAYLLAPLKYEIVDDAVKVRRSRPFGMAVIPLAGLKEVRVLEKGELNLWKTYKLWAASGCFGYFGMFGSRNLGRFWMSCTALTGAVLLSGDRKWIISPADAEGFVNEVRRRVSNHG